VGWFQVGGSFGCARRAVLDERIKSSDLSMPALLGTMLHQLFQVLLTLFFGWFYWQIRLGETLGKLWGKPRGIRIHTHCTSEFLEICFGELLHKKLVKKRCVVGCCGM